MWILKDDRKPRWRFDDQATTRSHCNHRCELAEQSALGPLKRFLRKLSEYLRAFSRTVDGN